MDPRTSSPRGEQLAEQGAKSLVSAAVSTDSFLNR